MRVELRPPKFMSICQKFWPPHPPFAKSWRYATEQYTPNTFWMRRYNIMCRLAVKRGDGDYLHFAKENMITIKLKPVCTVPYRSSKAPAEVWTFRALSFIIWHMQCKDLNVYMSFLDIYIIS